MKYLKISLVLYLSIHMFSSLLFNISAIGKLNTDRHKTYLNPFGQFMTDISSTDMSSIKKVLRPYGAYTGTNIGYEFFSPNIASVIKLRYFNKDQELFLPIKSLKGKLFYQSAQLYIHAVLDQKEIRNSILESFTLRLFELNPKLTEIETKVYITIPPNLEQFIEDGVPTEEQLFYTFKISKDENIALKK